MASTAAIGASTTSGGRAEKKWKTHSRTDIYKGGKWLTLQQHKVEVSPQLIINDWLWVESPAFCNVAVVTANGEWLLFRQPKYAVGLSLGDDTCLACVGGYVEKGEDALTAAKREVLEEVGLQSDEWVHLSSGVADANRGSGVGHLFLCTNAVPVSQDDKARGGHDDLEEQHLLSLSLDEVEDAVATGAFRCHSWAACMAQAVLHVHRRARKASG